MTDSTAETTSNANLEAGPLMPTPVTLTEAAADMVTKALKEEGLDGHGLRVGVMGGGCSGLQYMMDFAEKSQEDDLTAEHHGVSVFVDPYSAAHLAGTVIDYIDDENGTGFKFDNPNMVRTCGCGSAGGGH